MEKTMILIIHGNHTGNYPKRHAQQREECILATTFVHLAYTNQPVYISGLQSIIFHHPKHAKQKLS